MILLSKLPVILTTNNVKAVCEELAQGHHRGQVEGIIQYQRYQHYLFHMCVFQLDAGEVTDVRIAKTSSGKSRQFGFIGFRNEEQAQSACSYFNNSFIESSRISVQSARKVGDPTMLDEAKSKLTKKKLLKAAKALSAAQLEAVAKKPVPNGKASKATSAAPAEKISRDKLDFQAVMKARRSGAHWTNDDVVDKLESAFGSSAAAEDDSRSDSSDDESDTNDFSGLLPPHGSALIEDSPAPTKSNVGLSDLDFLHSKVRAGVVDSDDDMDTPGSKSVTSKRKAVKTAAIATHIFEEEEVEGSIEGGKGDLFGASSEQSPPDVAEGRLFLRNLPFSCSEEELKSTFESFGPVTEVHLPLDGEQKCKGFGFVQYMIPEHANRAKTSLDGSSFQGRVLHVIDAKERSKEQENASEAAAHKYDGRSSYQVKKDQERRLLAGKVDSWNSSFVRADTVVSSLAEKLVPHGARLCSIN